MPQFQEHDGITNRILLSLPLAALKRMLPALELVNMARGQVLGGTEKPITHLHFVNRGLVSLVKTMRDGRAVEIDAIGIEGVIDPCSLFAIDNAILESVVEIPGAAFRVRRDILGDQMAEDPAFLGMMRNYAKFVMSQIVETAACDRLHSLEQRCCRRLLIAHDSALTDTFPLTHEFLALMLGVNRSSVSIAARILKKAGLIEYTRGHVAIRNRSGLEKAACECYGSIWVEREKLFRVS
jgi:CRP-like cAMP-binding protein